MLPSLPLPLSGAACTSTLHMGQVRFLSSHSPMQESQNTWLQGSLNAAPGSQAQKHTGQVHPGSSLIGTPMLPPPANAPFPLVHISFATLPAARVFRVRYTPTVRDDVAGIPVELSRYLQPANNAQARMVSCGGHMVGCEASTHRAASHVYRPSCRMLCPQDCCLAC